MGLIRRYATDGEDASGWDAVLTAAGLEAPRDAKPRVRLPDVRTPGEYEAARIRGAYNVPLDSLAEHAEEIRARVDDPVVRGARRISPERQVRIAAGALAATGGILALAVNPLFAALPAFGGSGLVFAGVRDTRAMGIALSGLPYNRPASCDVDAMVAALKAGTAPVGAGGGASGEANGCAAWVTRRAVPAPVGRADPPFAGVAGGAAPF
jgi:hypothetical protein